MFHFKIHQQRQRWNSISFVLLMMMILSNSSSIMTNALRVPIQGYRVFLSPADSSNFNYQDGIAVSNLAEEGFNYKLRRIDFSSANDDGEVVTFKHANLLIMESVLSFSGTTALFYDLGGYVEFEVESLQSLPSQVYIQGLLEEYINQDLVNQLNASVKYSSITKVEYKYDPEPTIAPSAMPSASPSHRPTSSPTSSPSKSPTLEPTISSSPSTTAPVVSTTSPTRSPSPSESPSKSPVDVTFIFPTTPNTIQGDVTRSSSPNATITTVAVVSGGLALTVLILSLLVAKRKREIRNSKYKTESIEKAHENHHHHHDADVRSEAGSSGIGSILRAVTSGRLPAIPEVEESPSVCTSSDETPDGLSDVDAHSPSRIAAAMRMLGKDVNVEKYVDEPDVKEQQEQQQLQQQEQLHNYDGSNDDAFVSSPIKEVEPNIIPLSSCGMGSPTIIPIDVGLDNEDKFSYASSSTSGENTRVCGFIPRFPFWNTAPQPSTGFPTSQSLSGQDEIQQQAQQQQNQQQQHNQQQLHGYYPSNVSASALGEKDGFDKWSDRSSTDGEFQTLEDGLDYPMGTGSDFWDPHQDVVEYGGLRVLDAFERPPRMSVPSEEQQSKLQNPNNNTNDDEPLSSPSGGMFV